MGETDSWRVRGVEVSVGYKMLNVCTKGFLVCYTLVIVKFNGVLDFSGTVLTLFRYVYHEGVDTVALTLKDKAVLLQAWSGPGI